MVNEAKKNIDVKKCPWEITSMSPRHKEMKALVSYMYERMSENDTILEFGCGVSSWYLTQLGFKRHVCCETFEPAIEQVKNNCSKVEIVGSWVDIPRQQYDWVFVDSKVGGGVVGKYKRHTVLEYACENNLLKPEAVMIAHDYRRIRRSLANKGSIWEKKMKGWNQTIEKYNWELIHEILNFRGFGIYKRRG